MKTIHRSRQFWLSTTFLVTLAASGALTSPALAQFSAPPGQGAPKGTAGGGSRSPLTCLTQADSQASLIALAPTETIGLTTKAHPTVWVYVPPSKAKTLEFSLFTQNQEGIYQVEVPIQTTGLVKLTLPPSIELQTDKPYYWAAALVCNPKRRTEDWIVGGWIQRQPFSADLQRHLTGATAEQQFKLYVQSGFWYEALTMYLQLRETQAQNANLPKLWTDLLKQAGLESVAELSFMPQAPD